MPFQAPTFISQVRLWHGGGGGGVYATPDLTFMGTLSVGRRRLLPPNVGVPGSFSQLQAELLCPKLTDIRATWNNILADLVEVPGGSKRFYDVKWVDDVGKGFVNEYRLALIYMRVNPTGGGTAFGFSLPVPLP
jgi:hypothetical protein